ncbi:FeoB-associated Cys-rich membrane protein [Bacillus marasmi]|nr:FeoB-associated Cys-rich membrane protein [Bacillus marasmi]
MTATIVVGVIFAGILIFATRKVVSDAKNKKCNCSSSGSCSSKTKCS